MNLKKYFIKSDVNQYRIDVLKHMKWYSLILIALVLFIHFFSYSFSNKKSGYAVKTSIGTNIKVTNKILNTLLFSTTENFYPILCITNFDLLIVVVLLLFTHLFVKAILKFGPFHLHSIVWLKRALIVCFTAFVLKVLYSIFLDFQFEKDYPDSLMLDRDFYGQAYSWLYFAALIVFFINIFQYGRKLQEEQNLTV